MGRRVNDGDVSGMKQDRFRHSKYETQNFGNNEEQVYRANSNTLNGPFYENRGRRGDIPDSHQFNPDSPFENGELSSWGKRQGWDNYFSKKSMKPGRHGGGILNLDENDHRGRGPKGYKRLDENIFEEVCESLAADRNVDASDIEVEVTDGCVFLRGTVSDRNTKRLAENIIEFIPGVKDVQNLLTFRSGGSYAEKH